MKLIGHNLLLSSALGLVLAMGGVACGGSDNSNGDNTSAQSQQALGSFDASAGTKLQTGVQSWNFILDADGQVVVQGIGANASVVSEVHVQTIAGQTATGQTANAQASATVHVIKDANGELQVTADGQVLVNTLPSSSQTLIAALKVDIDLAILANAVTPGCFLVSLQYATAIAGTVHSCITLPGAQICIDAVVSVNVPDAQLKATCNVP